MPRKATPNNEVWRIRADMFGDAPDIPWIPRKNKEGILYAVFPTRPGEIDGTVCAKTIDGTIHYITYDLFIASSEAPSFSEMLHIHDALELRQGYWVYERATSSMFAECERRRRRGLLGL